MALAEFADTNNGKLAFLTAEFISENTALDHCCLDHYINYQSYLLYS